MQTDVIIVGAGPTGLALACQLIRFGIDFTIIDKKDTTTPYSRAIGVQARTLEIYEQIGLADKLIARGKPAEVVRMVAGGEVRGEAVLKDIGAGLSAYPFMLIVEQGTHEAQLYDHIRANGHNVRWNTELVSFAHDAEGVTAVIADAAGLTEPVHAKYLVGCDGASSPVRHQLGLTFEGDTVERLFYVADVEIDWKFTHDSLYICLAEHTITAFFPMVGRNRYRIVGTFPEGHDKDEGEILYEEIERQIELDTQLELDISNVNWFSVYKVHSRVVNKFSEGRCFVAGDAAHIHTPAGAQGMNTGIQDGYNLAWKLAMVLKHKADPKLLDTYNEERLPNAHRLLATTDRLFQLGASDEWFLAWIRMHIFPHVVGFALSLDSVKRFIFPLVSQIGVNYHNSSLSVDNTTFSVRGGDRMPYFRVGESVYDDLQTPRFHLVAFGGDGDLKLDGRLAEIIDNHLLPLSEEVEELFDTDRPFYVLLRPDNYIAVISDDPSLDAAEEYLGAIFP